MGPRRWTRRAALLSGAGALSAASLAQKGTLRNPEWREYADPATEFDLFRLTDPAHAALLPPSYAHVLDRRNGFLVFAANPEGSYQAYRMDLKNGDSRQLSTAAAFDPAAFTLTPDERSLCYWDGDTLRLLALRGGRDREVCGVAAGWQRCPGLSVTGDGVHALFGETRDGASRLRMVRLHTGAIETLTQIPAVLSHPIPRPRRSQVLYQRGDESLWLVNNDGQQNRQLKTAPGRIGCPNWAPSGRTILYLQFPEDHTQLNSIRELTPDFNQDKLVAHTSQYASMGFNRDTSVFVGASQNHASPYVLILLRLTRRELTVCDHHASHPATVWPFFSADSQWIYFQSDRDGKPALYRMRVNRLVEKTDVDEA